MTKISSSIIFVIIIFLKFCSCSQTWKEFKAQILVTSHGGKYDHIGNYILRSSDARHQYRCPSLFQGGAWIRNPRSFAKTYIYDKSAIKLAKFTKPASNFWRSSCSSCQSAVFNVFCILHTSLQRRGRWNAIGWPILLILQENERNWVKDTCKDVDIASHARRPREWRKDSSSLNGLDKARGPSQAKTFQ